MENQVEENKVEAEDKQERKKVTLNGDAAAQVIDLEKQCRAMADEINALDENKKN